MIAKHSAADPRAHERILRYQRTLDCVHCGLCLPVCPTYAITGKESASPRGRIYLMRAFAEERLEVSSETIREIDACLVCRACETVCPSGVQFGEMMELSRDLIEDTPARSDTTRWLKRWFFRTVLPRPALLRIAVDVLALYQRTGLCAAARFFGLPHLFGMRTATRDAMMPRVPPSDRRRNLPDVSMPFGERRARVGFLVGCVAHELLPDANRAAIAVLQYNGCEVVCPPSRPCCGALPLHFGDVSAARRLARATIESFPQDLDAVVVSSAGCAAAMKEYARMFENDPLRMKAVAFASKVKDFSEFLVALPFHPPEGRLDVRVAYDEPCHLIHAQRISEAPKKLLQSIPGLTLVPFSEQEMCCGAAGLYTLLEPTQSIELLERKMERLVAVKPDLIATANPGCQLQLVSGAREYLPDAEVLHIAEILLRSYEGVAPADARRPLSTA